MKNFLDDIKTFLAEIIGLIGGLCWGYNAKWDYEPVILISISSLGILVFLIMRFYNFNNFQVKLFSESGQEFLEPKFERLIRKSKLVTFPDHLDAEKQIRVFRNVQRTKEIISKEPRYQFNSVNHSWVELEVEMTNTGSTVIEDWKVDFLFEDGITRISDRSTNMGVASIPDLSPMSQIAIIEEEEKSVYYRPYKSRPLIQKDSRTFKVPILIDPNVTSVSVSWEILARDFNISGNAKIAVKPIYEEKIEVKDVFDASELFEDEISVRSLIKDK